MQNFYLTTLQNFRIITFMQLQFWNVTERLLHKVGTFTQLQFLNVTKRFINNVCKSLFQTLRNDNMRAYMQTMRAERYTGSGKLPFKTLKKKRFVMLLTVKIIQQF